VRPWDPGSFALAELPWPGFVALHARWPPLSPASIASELCFYPQFLVTMERDARFRAANRRRSLVTAVALHGLTAAKPGVAQRTSAPYFAFPVPRPAVAAALPPASGLLNAGAGVNSLFRRSRTLHPIRNRGVHSLPPPATHSRRQPYRKSHSSSLPPSCRRRLAICCAAFCRNFRRTIGGMRFPSPAYLATVTALAVHGNASGPPFVELFARSFLFKQRRQMDSHL
jgi:hypothetical protein